MERVATGVNGFDTLVEGGLPKGSTIAVTGNPGTGKTIFGLTYLYNGALKGEPGIYIAIDSALDLLREQARQCGMDIDKVEKDGKFFFVSVPINERKFNIFEMIKQVKEDMNATRIVLDSLASFTINIDLFSIPAGYSGNVASSIEGPAPDIIYQSGAGKIGFQADTQKRLVNLVIEELRRLGTTNIIITFGNQASNQITVDGVSEFACDGIVEMYNELIGAKHVRTMSILKMRDTNHSPYVLDFEIGKTGITVKPVGDI